MDIDKYKFYITETKFLNFIIEINRIAVNLKKVKALKNWQIPTTVKKMQFFSAFAIFTGNLFANSAKSFSL